MKQTARAASTWHLLSWRRLRGLVRIALYNQECKPRPCLNYYPARQKGVNRNTALRMLLKSCNLVFPVLLAGHWHAHKLPALIMGNVWCQMYKAGRRKNAYVLIIRAVYLELHSVLLHSKVSPVSLLFFMGFLASVMP